MSSEAFLHLGDGEPTRCSLGKTFLGKDRKEPQLPVGNSGTPSTGVCVSLAYVECRGQGGHFHQHCLAVELPRPGLTEHKYC